MFIRQPIWLVCCGLAALSSSARAERELEFLRGLRERGYFDLALMQIDRMAKLQGLPAEAREILDFEHGQAALGLVGLTEDLEAQEKLYNQAQARFAAFVKAHSKHLKAPTARLELARIILGRGALKVQMGQLPANRSKQPVFYQQARVLFKQARDTLTKARNGFETHYKSFPGWIKRSDPLYQKREEVLLNLVESEFQLALVRFEEAHTFPEQDPNRQKLLQQAANQFAVLYSKHREWLVGQFAHMFEGKCYEELGDLQKALGFYHELLEQPDDPALVDLHREVQYFRLICLNKKGREESRRVVEEARLWIDQNPRLARTETGLGVRLEKAKAHITLGKTFDKAKDPTSRRREFRDAARLLTDVKNTDSPSADVAAILLGQISGELRAAGKPTTWEEFAALGHAMFEKQQWQEASKYFRGALVVVGDEQNKTEVLDVRYRLGYAFYQGQDYYRAAILLSDIGRRFPTGEYGINAAWMALAAYQQKYAGTPAEARTPLDLELVLGAAEELVQFYPGSGEADDCRFLVADVRSQQARWIEAATMFETVTHSSPKWAEAQRLAGDAWWQAYLKGEADGQPRDELKTYQSNALKYLTVAYQESENVAAQLRAALAAHRKNIAALTKQAADEENEAARVQLAEEKTKAADAQKRLTEHAKNVLLTEAQLAGARVESGQYTAALELLKPRLTAYQQKQIQLTPAQHQDMLIAALRCYVIQSQLDQADKIITDIEQASGQDSGRVTAVFVDLGQRLEREVKRLETTGDTQQLQRVRKSYVGFLDRIGKRQSGLTFPIMSWVAETFSSLGDHARASANFKRILTTFKQDASIPQDQLQRIELRLAQSYRANDQNAEALTLVEALLKARPNALNLHFELGDTLQALQRWEDAEQKWGYLSLVLQTRKEAHWHRARLHLIECYVAQGKTEQAQQAYRFTKALTKDWGGPELERQFKELAAKHSLET